MNTEFIKIIEERDKPLSQELKDKWIIGRKSARAWAKLRGCDRNGVLLIDIPQKQDYIPNEEQCENIFLNIKETFGRYKK